MPSSKTESTRTAPDNGDLIELFVVDVDGTLLTPDKELTDGARRAAGALRDAGVRLALTSGRPPRGLEMLVEPLALTLPLAAFNGGMFARPDLTIVDQHSIERDAARAAVRLIDDHGLDVWVYRGADWYLRDRDAPHVDRERRTVQFAPKTAGDLFELLDEAVKIVGVSDDENAMARCERAARDLGPKVYAARSQPYYLDITHPKANKGEVVRYFARTLSIDQSRIATIGDMPNDVAMFEAGGLGIAMGNADEEVQRQADRVTASNTEDGFAQAVDQLILPRARRRDR